MGGVKTGADIRLYWCWYFLTIGEQCGVSASMKGAVQVVVVMFALAPFTLVIRHDS